MLIVKKDKIQGLVLYITCRVWATVSYEFIVQDSRLCLRVCVVTLVRRGVCNIPGDSQSTPQQLPTCNDVACRW